MYTSLIYYLHSPMTPRAVYDTTSVPVVQEPGKHLEISPSHEASYGSGEAFEHKIGHVKRMSRRPTRTRNVLSLL